MRFGNGLLLGGISALAAAGILPVRHAADTLDACSTVTVYGTVYATVFIHDTVTVTQTTTQTITNTPATITVVEQDPASIARSMASIDTQQVIEQSQLLPISDIPDPNPTKFTHSVSVSGFEATEISNNGNGGTVFYMSMGASSTDWSFTPSATIVAEVTTVTVLPVPQPSPNHGKGVVDSNTTVHAQFTSPAGGWNGTYSNTSSWSPATASAGIASPYGVASTITVTNIVATVTQTAASSITTAPTYGYGPPQSSYAPPKASNNDGIEKRQTCVWISAVIGGQEVGWCNNWDGSTTLTYTSWETTVFPTWVPGIGPVGTPSTTPSSSPPPVTATEQSSMQPASSVAPSTTACGQTGPFEIGFDDLPVFSVANNDTADFPPVFNPYEHFYWGPGWSYVPPPNEPYPPQNGSRLAEFIPPLANNDTGSPDAGLIPPSSFGAGPRASVSTYWFSASSAWVACDNGATDWSQTCDFVATAYQWNNATQSEVVVATQHFSIPPCPNFVDCHLTEINFNYLFYKMTTLSFYANVQGKISIFWLDSLALNWYDNTCQAGLKRISSRKI